MAAVAAARDSLFAPAAAAAVDRAWDRLPSTAPRGAAAVSHPCSACSAVAAVVPSSARRSAADLEAAAAPAVGEEERRRLRWRRA